MSFNLLFVLATLLLIGSTAAAAYGSYESDSDQSYEHESYDGESYGAESYDDQSYNGEDYANVEYGAYKDEGYKAGPDKYISGYDVMTGVEPTTPPRRSRPSDKLSKKMLKMSMKLFEALERGKRHHNTVYSPLSLFSALTTLRAAARGSARKELDKFMGTRKIASDEIGEYLQRVYNGSINYKLQAVDRVFHSLKLSKNFRKDLEALHATSKSMDFGRDTEQKRLKINHYVARHTSQLIPEILPEGSLTGDTVVLFVNALLLKASWDHAFENNVDVFQGFHQFGEQEPVPVKCMMRHPAAQCKVGYLETEHSTRVLVLPLANRNLEMIYIPTENKPFPAQGKIRSLLKQLDQSDYQTCDVTVPKVALEHRVPDVKETLRLIGIREVFDPAAARPALGKMLASRDRGAADVIRAGRVEHATVVRVDERGVEAAAATAVQITARSAVLETIRVDRPFYFILRHAPSKTLLFMGKVVRV